MASELFGKSTIHEKIHREIDIEQQVQKMRDGLGLLWRHIPVLDDRQ